MHTNTKTRKKTDTKTVSDSAIVQQLLKNRNFGHFFSRFLGKKTGMIKGAHNLKQDLDKYYDSVQPFKNCNLLVKYFREHSLGLYKEWLFDFFISDKI